MKIFSVSSKFMDSSFCGINVPCVGVWIFFIESARPAHEKEYFSSLVLSVICDVSYFNFLKSNFPSTKHDGNFSCNHF